MRPILLFLTISLALAGTASAQINFNPPNPPSEFLEARRRLGGDALRICVSSDSLLEPVDRAVASAVGELLLVDVALVEVPSLRNVPVLDHRMALSQTELFTLMNNECPVYAGFLLSTSGFADWLTITRPYLRTRSVFASTDAAAASLAAMPAGSRIGTRIGANVDIRFLDLNQGRTEANRWRRVPYPNNQFLLDRLREGELDAILLWEPALVVGLGGDPAAQGVFPGSLAPVVVDDQSFGFILLQRDGFLRAAIDEAIALLSEDGTIARILEETGIPGVVPR